MKGGRSVLGTGPREGGPAVENAGLSFGSTNPGGDDHGGIQTLRVKDERVQPCKVHGKRGHLGYRRGGAKKETLESIQTLGEM